MNNLIPTYLVVIPIGVPFSGTTLVDEYQSCHRPSNNCTYRATHRSELWSGVLWRRLPLRLWSVVAPACLHTRFSSLCGSLWLVELWTLGLGRPLTSFLSDISPTWMFRDLDSLTKRTICISCWDLTIISLDIIYIKILKLNNNFALIYVFY